MRSGIVEDQIMACIVVPAPAISGSELSAWGK